MQWTHLYIFVQEHVTVVEPSLLEHGNSCDVDDDEIS